MTSLTVISVNMPRSSSTTPSFNLVNISMLFNITRNVLGIRFQGGLQSVSGYVSQADEEVGMSFLGEMKFSLLSFTGSKWL